MVPARKGSPRAGWRGGGGQRGLDRGDEAGVVGRGIGGEPAEDAAVAIDQEFLEIPVDLGSLGGIAEVAVGVNLVWGSASVRARYSGCFCGPVTVILLNIGKSTPKVEWQKSAISASVPGSCPLKSLAGNQDRPAAIAVGPKEGFEPSYCTVVPHFDATLTMRSTFPA